MTVGSAGSAGSAGPMTRVYSPRRWALFQARGGVVPAGLAVFSAWDCDHDGGVGFGAGWEEARAIARMGIGPGEPEPRLLWVIMAPDWDEACTRYHEVMGWEPYVPMVDGWVLDPAGVAVCVECGLPATHGFRVGRGVLACCPGHALQFCIARGVAVPATVGLDAVRAVLVARLGSVAAAEVWLGLVGPSWPWAPVRVVAAGFGHLVLEDVGRVGEPGVAFA